MSVLITGGAGFIGSHTCVELLQAGEEIVVVDNFVNSKPAALKAIQTITGREFPFYEVDLLEEEKLEQVFEHHAIDCVIHFAGLKAVGESVRQPLRYYHNNLTGSLVLSRVMERHGCKRLVFSSSATVYGNPHTVPITEDFPLSATNPYGATKLMLERIFGDFCVADPEWSVTLLRYFNPIGAHESGLIGEDPNGIPNNLMPYICQVAAGKLDHLNVFGNDYPTPDGTGVRDYIHVVDLARGHCNAVKYAREHTGCDAINLGTGKGYSVLDIVHAFEAATGVKVPYEIAPRRAGDIPTCYADPSKAKRVLGWQAQYGLEEMCRSAWNYILHKKEAQP